MTGLGESVHRREYPPRYQILNQASHILHPGKSEIRHASCFAILSTLFYQESKPFGLKIT